MFITCGVCSGQNLVPNWSFEDTVACPWYYHQIFLATGWSSYKETPDYFNACNTTLVGVPANVEGFQFANTGSAYAGGITYSSFTVNYREVMGTQLTQPLIIGQKYFVSFFVSRAYDSTNVLLLSSNKIGLRFSTVPFSYFPNNPTPINNFAHVYTDSIVTDTLNWTKISGSLIADSAYSYVAIGNFFDDSNTSISNLDTSIFNEYAYYYIDDIKVSTDSVFVNGTNEQNNNGNQFAIYPNPFSDKINITTKRNELVELNLFDVTARKIFNQSFINSTSINTEQLAKGIYIYEVRNKNGMIKTGKVVKE